MLLKGQTGRPLIKAHWDSDVEINGDFDGEVKPMDYRNGITLGQVV